MASLKKIGDSYRITVELGRENGKRKRKYITIKDKNVAKAVLANYNSQEKFGGFVAPNKKKFKETIEFWLYNHALPNIELLTFVSYHQACYKYIIPKLGDIPTQQLTVSDLERYYAYLINDCNLSANTVKHHHANIHRALKLAKRNKEVINNVADDVELPTVNQFEHEVYTSHQLRVLFDKARKKDIYIPILIGAYTGLRRSEIACLTWACIDFKERIIMVRNAKVTIRSSYKKYYRQHHGKFTKEGNLVKKTKNKTSNRDVPMSEKLYDILWTWRFEQKALRVKAGEKAVYNDFVCTMREDGREMKPDYISQAFHKLLVANNLPLIRFHDLRGTLGTLLVENNENLLYVTKLFGHYDSTTTEKRYIKTVKNRMKKVGDKIDEII